MVKAVEMCPKHDKPMQYSRKLKIWYCEDCLYASHLTHEAQMAAIKRYRQSEKGKEAEKTYEQSEKGKTARERYLKSEKYKQRRREYNQRLKESLQLARAAHLERPTQATKVEELRAEELSGLLADIREYIDSSNRMPTPEKVVKSALDDYGQVITKDKAVELINAATQRRRR